MNFKSIILAAVVLTNIACYQTQAVNQITSDAQFRGATYRGKQVIGIADEQDPRLIAINAELNSVQNSGIFGSVSFYIAAAENIRASVAKYQLGALPLIAVFNNGSCIARIQFPIDTNSLINQLKGLLGGRSLVGM